jgi:hypothetical protein
MLKLEWIREKIREGEYYYSGHGDNERQAEELKLSEVEEALSAGSILEEYEDTGRGKSCLVVGFSKQGKPVHAVCGKRGDKLSIITVYVPKSPKFKTPYERG